MLATLPMFWIHRGYSVVLRKGMILNVPLGHLKSFLFSKQQNKRNSLEKLSKEMLWITDVTLLIPTYTVWHHFISGA